MDFGKLTKTLLTLRASRASPVVKEGASLQFSHGQIWLRFLDLLGHFGGQVQSDLKWLGNRLLGRDLHFLKKVKNDQKWVWVCP